VARGRSTVAVGFTYFAAVMMMLSGAFEILQGLSAIIKKHFYVVGSDYVYKINVTTWGWIHLILGVIILLAGVALLGGALWARIVGIALAALIVLANFLWLPYYPVWAVVIIAVNVLVIWALAAHGRDIAT
jgi:TRAP-type mannitol/chloroaromatic compound transport system permease small subunit